MAAAVPFALKAAPFAASAIGGWFGKKSSKPNSAQQGGLDAMAQAGKDVRTAGAAVTPYTQPLLQGGMQDLDTSGGYYRGILGSRAQATQAIAPETTTALNYYRGAEQSASRNLRGADRTNAMAELGRQKVGQLASYLPAARAGAAGALANLGFGRLSGGFQAGQMGLQAATNAGALATGQFNMGSRIYDQQKDAGKSWGGFLFDLAKSFPWGGGGSARPGHGGIYDVND